MKPVFYVFAVRCRCGNQIDIESAWHDYPEPQKYICTECETEYELSAKEKAR